MSTAVIMKAVPKGSKKVPKPSLWLHVLCCGYMRQHLSTRNVNVTDIGQIVAKFLDDDFPFEFDYCFDYLFIKQGSTIHCIEINGKH